MSTGQSNESIDVQITTCKAMKLFRHLLGVFAMVLVVAGILSGNILFLGVGAFCCYLHTKAIDVLTLQINELNSKRPK